MVQGLIELVGKAFSRATTHPLIENDGVYSVITAMPEPRVLPYTMEDETKVALRNFADSERGAQWTLDFAKVSEIKDSKVKIKFIHDQ